MKYLNETEIGNRLRTLRERRGVSSGDIACRIGVDEAELLRWECGEKLPNLRQSIRLAEEYHLPLTALISQEITAVANERLHKKGLYGIAKVGERGQIVIPQAARRAFGIRPGDQLLVFGDVQEGIELRTVNVIDEVY